MKRIIFLMLIMIASNLLAQTLTQEMMKSENRPKSQFTEYEAVNGYIYKVGDKLKTGVGSGQNGMFLNVFEGSTLTGFEYCTNSLANIETEIKSIAVTGTKRTGWKVQMACKHPTGMMNILIYLEDAILAGEIVSEGYTREKAIKELKEAKDLLDLGIIDQSEYARRKEELSKYIIK